MAPGAPVPMYHCVPRVPSAPRGIEKSKVAAFDEPEFVTVALEPAAPVETVPTAIVAAAPSLPLVPASPLGIVKLNVAAELVPELLTAAELPATPVVTVPTATVAAGSVPARTSGLGGGTPGANATSAATHVFVPAVFDGTLYVAVISPVAEVGAFNKKPLYWCNCPVSPVATAAPRVHPAGSVKESSGY